MGDVVGLKTGSTNFFLFFFFPPLLLLSRVESISSKRLSCAQNYGQRFLTFFNVFESRITGENCATGDPSNYVKSRAFPAGLLYAKFIHEEKAFPSAIRENSFAIRHPRDIFHYIFEL